MPATYSYLRVEAVNLDHFLSDTADLSTIRGGGLALLHMTEWLAREFPLTPVSVGASVGLFRVDRADDEAAALCADVRRFLATHAEPFTSVEGRQETFHLHHATIVADLIPASGDFVHDRRRLTAMNRWRQMQSPSLAVPGPASEHICAIDGIRPAATRCPSASGELIDVSPSVYERREYGRVMKQQFYTSETGLNIPMDFSTDFNSLAADPAQGNLHNKMAVIYIDGNDFGALQDTACRDEEAQRAFNGTVRQCRSSFLRTLVREAMDDPEFREEGDRIRLETLLWGGDELLLVVPAWKGLDTLALFYDLAVRDEWTFTYTDAGGATVRRPLRHAAGLVFCHHKAPIHRVKSLAEGLADLAKAMDRQRDLFAYEVLESFDHIGVELDTYRAQRCPFGATQGDFILDGTQVSRITELAAEVLPHLAKSPLMALVQSIAAGPGDADEDTWDQANRKRAVQSRESLSPAAQASLETLIPLLGGEPAAWMHLASLWDYVPLATAGALRSEGT